MLSDLTFRFDRSRDLHIHPFVPLDNSPMSLALVAKFPLHSLPDENILRICSQLRPKEFDRTSNEKEAEMLAALGKMQSGFLVQGPIALPSPTPDIDLLVSDEQSDTVVVAEMKWIRKTSRPLEFEDRDADVLKGIGQLEEIRHFLANNPDYLPSQRKLPKKINEYKKVFYLLVARDHWVWIEPREGLAIVEFTAFSSAINRSERLDVAIENLLTYDWLPVEGHDFSVQFDQATAGGVAIQSEVFYAISETKPGN